MARLAAVHAYLAVRGELPVNVKFFVEGEEEIGSPSLRGFVEKNKELLQSRGFYDRVKPPTAADYEALAAMEYDEEKTLEKFGLNSFLLNLSGLPLKEKLIYQPTCTICGFESGYTEKGKKTVLPAEARVKLDFRLVPDQDPREIQRLIRQHLDEHGFSDIEIITHTLTYPAQTPLNSQLADAVIESAVEVYGKKPVIEPMSPATGPMYIFCQQLGIPSVSVGVGNFTSNNHAPNENIFVDDFILGIKHIAAIIRVPMQAMQREPAQTNRRKKKC